MRLCQGIHVIFLPSFLPSFRCRLLLLAAAVELWLLHNDGQHDWLALLLRCSMSQCCDLELQLRVLGFKRSNPALVVRLANSVVKVKVKVKVKMKTKIWLAASDELKARR